MFVLLAKKAVKRAVEIDPVTLLLCGFLAFQAAMAIVGIYLS